MLLRKFGTLTTINNCREGWFSYVNRDLTNTDFTTDILAYIASNDEKPTASKVNEDYAAEYTIEYIAEQKIKGEVIISERISEGIDAFSTKDTGDIGEGLVHGHECMRLKLGGRVDLIHLIKRIPSQFAVGYDICSVELDERQRYIEVKTTISSKPLNFNRVHLTKNEWNAANTTRDRYFVYRLMLSKTEKRLCLLQDPVGLYKAGKIDMVPNQGAEITFNPYKVGQIEELLTWRA